MKLSINARDKWKIDLPDDWDEMSPREQDKIVEQARRDMLDWLSSEIDVQRP